MKKQKISFWKPKPMGIPKSREIINPIVAMIIAELEENRLILESMVWVPLPWEHQYEIRDLFDSL